MQGHRSSLSTLPENFTFDNGSITSNPSMDPQIPWNTLPTPALNRLATDETNIQYLRHLRHGGQNAEWSFGEGSSSSAQNHQHDRKPEQTWSFRSRTEPSNIPSLDFANLSSSNNQTAIPSGSFLLPSHPSSATFPQDLNISSVFDDDDDDDDCRIVERPDICASAGPSNVHMMPPGNSDSLFVPAGLPGYRLQSEDRSGCSSDGRRVSCKRKALEVSAGQSSGAGSSNSYQTADVIPWHTLPASSIPSSNISSGATSQIDHMELTQNGLGQVNPRLRLGAGGGVSANPFSLTPSGISESSRRNFRLRLHQQDPGTGANLFPAEADVGVGSVTPSRHSSRLLLRNQLLDLNPLPAVENGTTNGGQYGRRAAQTRWSGPSNSRSTRSSASAAFPDPISFEDSMRRTIPRTISEHPMFVQAGETASASHHNPINWNNMVGGSSGIVGNVASSAGVGSNSGAANSSESTWPSRNYPRRLTEIVRRSLLSSAGVESGNHGLRPTASASTTQETGLSASDAHGLLAPTSRSALLGRNLESILGTPHSHRTLAAGGEGRNSIMSEQIRHVLNLMRRGEGLRMEDMMLLDHSVILGMADMHDRHRDMRLDVDNMSYEELLALGERIGDVCTGLTEATIMKHLKQHKFTDNREKSRVETEPCSICREEYIDGEDLGRLECGHDFHKDCIKQWLVQKNSCPICKKTGLTI